VIPDVDEWDATETMMEITLTKFIWVSMVIDRDFGFEETCVCFFGKCTKWTAWAKNYTITTTTTTTKIHKPDGWKD